MAARRQRRTFGCVQRVRRDVYRLRWTDAGRRRSETVYGSRADAERRMSEIQTQTDETRPRMMRVSAIWERLAKPEYERRLTERAFGNIESCWRRHIEPAFGSEYVDGIKAAAFQEWLLGLTPFAAGKSVEIMRNIMRHAVMMELIDHSPLDIRFEMPAKASREHDKSVIESGMISEYHSAVRGTLAEAPFILGACAGLRVGEMLGVKVGEIDYEDGMAVFEVRREAGENGGIVRDRDGGERVKTKASRRWAVVYEPYASRLMELQSIAEARGDVFLSDDGSGNPISKHALRRIWDAACSDAGLRKVLLRNLRPTFATSMHHSVGMQTDDIARLMGHAKPTITYGTYERPSRSDIVASAAKVVRS